jgi:phosphatidylglycerol lysyltransferase
MDSQGTGPAGAGLRMRGWHRLRRLAPVLLAVGAGVLLLVLLQAASASLDYKSVIKALRRISAPTLSLALLATAVSYAALVARDAMALRHMGLKLPWPALLVGGVAGSALGNAVGLGALTGGAVRYRVYGAAGITPGAVARVTVLTAATFGLALVAWGGLGLLLAAGPMAALSGVSVLALRGLGVAGLLATAAVLALGGRGVVVRGRRIEVPPAGFVLGQIGLVGIDVLGAGLSLWVLLPASAVSFGTFLAVYTAALLLGVIGHTPGGLGVFEAALLFVLGGAVPAGGAVAALLAYRAVYFVLPLGVSAVLLAGFEARHVVPRLMGRIVPKLMTPVFLAVITFAVGMMLVLSGATPAFGKRLALLQMVVPLWVVEASQLASSVLGVFLLFTARGLMFRLDGAWWLALVLGVASLGLSLAKGLAFFEASVLLGFVALLLATRGSFRRQAPLLAQRITLGWVVAVALVMALAVWVLFFAFRAVPYSPDLWGQFEFDEKLPRALRATLAAVLAASAFALRQLLRPAAGRVGRPSAAALAEAAVIVRGQERSDAMLALMGDKDFLFSPTRRAFLMYAKRGRSWVALYDPVGPREEWPALIADFVALAHRHDGRAAFYQVRPDCLPMYLDAGLKLMKLGEEATIALDQFGLEGARRQHLRYALKRGERDGLCAEVLDAAGVAAALPQLREISDAWLASHKAREKKFSVAAFDPAWLAPQSVMLVRQNGRPVAFVSFMTTDLHTQATVGVMRHVEDASAYAMEFLFTRLALHLKEAGFVTLSLGMAPLSGIAPTPLASYWHRIGHLLWRYGGRVYNFRGLRSFKSKFGPVWEPRYLAASGTFGPFLSLADVAVLSGST